MPFRPRAWLSWSSGKDSAWSLHVLREQARVEVVGLLTTFDEAAERVAMHGVRRELARAQAEAAGLPLVEVDLPVPCANEDYERLLRGACERAVSEGVTRVAFGDLFLRDVREYREKQLAGTGLEPLFPLWEPDGGTPVLARTMQAAGLRSVLTTVDPRQLDPAFVGRAWDAELLSELPAGVDPCGENGEFHTFCTHGPAFAVPVEVTVGEASERDGFWFADLAPG